jgi:tRNA pseudouridine38-40 synthase
MEPTALAAEQRSGQPSPRRIAMRVVYDGTDFLGWQRQAQGRTVQEELERILTSLCSERPVTVIGAGRTDSGVHASGQVAHADVATHYDDARLLHALRRVSPDDLAVASLATVDPGFHARFTASSRSYRYTIISTPDPFRARYSWHVGYHLDDALLRDAASMLVGRHDFTALSKHNPDTENPICTVEHAEWNFSGKTREFEITADRFLYGMVRLLVGFQIDIARGKRGLGELASALDSHDRAVQSMSAPARGLCLIGVGYPAGRFPAERM